MTDVSPYLRRPVRAWSRAFHDLYLAARRDRPPARARDLDEARPAETARRRRILVVDDDEDVRALVLTILADMSFDVLEAESGGAALEAMRRGGVDLLLTDIRMPGMDGLELARRAKAMNPDLRTLFMSGYAAQYRIDPDREDFVGKPFVAHELLGCVYEILARR